MGVGIGQERDEEGWKAPEISLGMGCLELRTMFHVALVWLFPAVVGSDTPGQTPESPWVLDKWS